MSDDHPIFEEPGPGWGGMTELQYTAYVGDLEWLQELLSAGADVNAVDHGEMSALHWAAYMGSVNGPREEILRALLEAGADPNLRDNMGRTPLYVAGQCGTADQVRILLKAGASENIIDEKGWSPLFSTIRSGDAEKIAAFLDHHAFSMFDTGPTGKRPLDMALTGTGVEGALVLKYWRDAKHRGNRWLSKLMRAPNEQALSAFRTHLAAIETGCNLRLTIAGIPGTDTNLTQSVLKEFHTLKSDDYIARTFREHWHRFLNLTGLILEPKRAAESLVVIFDNRFIFRGNASEWAWIQQTWADTSGFMKRSWADAVFFSEEFESEFQGSTERFLRLLQQRVSPIDDDVNLPRKGSTTVAGAEQYNQFNRVQLASWIVETALCHHDTSLALRHCRTLTAHRDRRVRANALAGLGFIAQIHGALSSEIDLPLIEEASYDCEPEVQQNAFFAQSQAAKFLGWRLPVRDSSRARHGKDPACFSHPADKCDQSWKLRIIAENEHEFQTVLKATLAKIDALSTPSDCEMIEISPKIREYSIRVALRSVTVAGQMLESIRSAQRLLPGFHVSGHFSELSVVGLICSGAPHHVAEEQLRCGLLYAELSIVSAAANPEDCD